MDTTPDRPRASRRRPPSEARRFRGSRSALSLCLGTALLALVAAGCGGASSPSRQDAPLDRPAPTRLPTPEEPAAARGAALYAEHCASCHGVNGEGEPDWKVARPDGSLPAPPHDSSGHTWHHPDAELLRILAEGGTVYFPESTMPGFAEILSKEEREDVLAFLKTLWGPEERAEQQRRTERWEAMQEGG